MRWERRERRGDSGVAIFGLRGFVCSRSLPFLSLPWPARPHPPGSPGRTGCRRPAGWRRRRRRRRGRRVEPVWKWKRQKGVGSRLKNKIECADGLSSASLRPRGSSKTSLPECARMSTHTHTHACPLNAQRACGQGGAARRTPNLCSLLFFLSPPHQQDRRPRPALQLRPPQGGQPDGRADDQAGQGLVNAQH